MKNFYEILTNIQRELNELREINLSLRMENNYLRQQLGMPANSDNGLSIDDAFKYVYLKDDSVGMRLRAINGLKRAGYMNISDFNGISIYDLIKIRNTGPSSCAIWILVFQHYGIHIELPDLDKVASPKDSRVLQKVYEQLPEFKERIEFTD